LSLILHTYNYFDWALYDNNVFELLDIYPTLTYFAKTSKFIDIFSNIKTTKSQTMNHMNYMHLKKSCKHITNDKVHSPYIRCSSKKKKKAIPIEHNIQPNKVEQC